jgi:hypothetical protein
MTKLFLLCGFDVILIVAGGNDARAAQEGRAQGLGLRASETSGRPLWSPSDGASEHAGEHKARAYLRPCLFVPCIFLLTPWPKDDSLLESAEGDAGKRAQAP